MTNKFLSIIIGLDIFSLSIFNIETVLPVTISITNNLPLLVER